MPGEAPRAWLWRQQVAQENGRAWEVGEGGWSLSSSSLFSTHGSWISAFEWIQHLYVCTFNCVLMCMEWKELIQDWLTIEKYNMNIWGVYSCYSCSLLQLIHKHNAHIHTTFSFLITFSSDKLLIHAHSIVTMECAAILKPLHISSSVFAATAVRKKRHYT